MSASMFPRSTCVTSRPVFHGSCSSSRPAKRSSSSAGAPAAATWSWIVVPSSPGSIPSASHIGSPSMTRPEPISNA